ncbi:MAG: hemolysin III family protein [Gemmataceae bacterium]
MIAHTNGSDGLIGMDASITFPRDPVSSLTHLGTSVFAIFVTLILWRLAGGDRTKRLSLLVFGLSAVVLYAASGTYHGIALPRSSTTVDMFRRLDHTAIYLLIAGTYTPIFAVLLRGRRRVILLSLVWLLATVGMISKWVMSIAVDRWTVSLYLALGWLSVLAARDLIRAVGWRGFSWTALGGLSYTLGAACELTRWPVIVPGVVGWHEVCHIFDMVGTALHVVFMIRCVVPYQSYEAQSQGLNPSPPQLLRKSA